MGSWVGDLGPDEMRDLRHAFAGWHCAGAWSILHKENGELMGKPEIISRGFAASQEAQEFLARLEKPVIETVKNSNGNWKRTSSAQ
jgi:ribonuclease J